MLIMKNKIYHANCDCFAGFVDVPVKHGCWPTFLCKFSWRNFTYAQ